jgi:hypothetical protein
MSPFRQDYLAYTKPRQNGQSITLAEEIDQPKVCPMHSTMQLVLRAKWLNQPEYMPIAVYKTKKGKVIYLTGNKIAKLLRKAVKEVRPNTTLDKLKQYSTHSLRVWACVLLDEAGKLRIISRRGSNGWVTPSGCTTGMQPSSNTSMWTHCWLPCRRSWSRRSWT